MQPLMETAQAPGFPAALQRTYPRKRVRSARLLDCTPPYLRAAKRETNLTAAQAAGHRHERRMHKYLETIAPRDYLASPWIEYETALGDWGVCQPDGILFFWDAGILLILEAKIRHTEQAYWQTENLYLPVVGVLFPLWEYAICEVVRWYDPAVRFPVQPQIVTELAYCSASTFNVFILRGAHLQ